MGGAMWYGTEKFFLWQDLMAPERFLETACAIYAWGYSPP